MAAACRLAGLSLMLELGDAEEPFRLVGEAWTINTTESALALCGVVYLWNRIALTSLTLPMCPIMCDIQSDSENKNNFRDECAVFAYISHPNLWDVDHDITIGHISHPNESLLNDPLALDLDIGHRSPGSQQEWRGA